MADSRILREKRKKHLSPDAFLQGNGEYGVKSDTIKDVKVIEAFGNEAYEIHFENEKPLTLNATNQSFLEEHYGYNDEDWVGNKVSMKIVEVAYAGQPKKGIRFFQGGKG